MNVQAPEDARCVHVRGEEHYKHKNKTVVVKGWGCCKCGAVNSYAAGLFNGRPGTVCARCGHSFCGGDEAQTVPLLKVPAGERLDRWTIREV